MRPLQLLQRPRLEVCLVHQHQQRLLRLLRVVSSAPRRHRLQVVVCSGRLLHPRRLVVDCLAPQRQQRNQLPPVACSEAHRQRPLNPRLVAYSVPQLLRAQPQRLLPEVSSEPRTLLHRLGRHPRQADCLVHQLHQRALPVVYLERRQLRPRRPLPVVCSDLHRLRPQRHLLREVFSGLPQQHQRPRPEASSEQHQVQLLRLPLAEDSLVQAALPQLPLRQRLPLVACLVRPRHLRLRPRLAVCLVPPLRLLHRQRRPLVGCLVRQHQLRLPQQLVACSDPPQRQLERLRLLEACSGQVQGRQQLRRRLLVVYSGPLRHPRRRLQRPPLRADWLKLRPMCSSIDQWTNC